MTNPSPRPALRKAEDATVHPAAPRPARAARAPKPAPTAVEPAASPSPAVPAPRTIADTNRDAVAAAEKRARKAKSKGRDAAKPAAATSKSGRKKGKFSGSTSDHLRVPGTEFVEHPAPTGGRKRSGRAAAIEPVAQPSPAPAAKAKNLMGGKVVDLGARVPKKLRTAAREEAKRRGLDIDAVTTELLHEWLTRRD
jgi:hypothetical protein